MGRICLAIAVFHVTHMVTCMPSDAAYQAFWGSVVPFEHYNVLFILLFCLWHGVSVDVMKRH